MSTVASPPIFTNEETLGRLKNHIEKESKGLNRIITEDLASYVGRAMSMFTKLVDEFGCTTEIATNLVVLTLYDIVILVDDSFSMKKDPTLFPKLITLIEQICEIYELANPAGIKSIIFMNHHKAGVDVKKTDVSHVLNWSAYTGVSRIGTELQRRVLNRFVLGQDSAIKKPFLVLIFTDGVIEGEGVGLLTKVIMNCFQKLSEAGRKEMAVAFQFISLGKDKGAKKLLQSIDNNEWVGQRVDCVLPEYHRLDTINDPEKWKGPFGKWHALPKILLGALLENFDNHDEDINMSDLNEFVGFEGAVKPGASVVEDD